MNDAIVKNILRHAEDNIKTLTIQKGEHDGDCYRYYLPNDFNNTINYCGATDILCSHVGVDGMLTFLVSDTNDNHQFFVDICDLPISVVDQIILAIR